MDPDDQFEDFTTASDWEQFTASLESILSEWMGKPPDKDNFVGTWMVLHEKVTFADFPLKFTYYKRYRDFESKDSSSILESSVESQASFVYPPYIMRMLASDPEFPPQITPSPVSEIFSIEEFAVLTSSTPEPVHEESKLKLLLSSACIALNNTNCNIPVFTQYHLWNHHYYYGIGETSGVRTAFQMIRLKAVHFPPYLSSLLDVFKSKIGQTLSAPIIITAHFFYNMNAWHEDFTFDSFPPELYEILRVTHDDNQSSHDTEARIPLKIWTELCSHTNLLPFGSLDDPFCSMELVVGWPSLTDDIVVDSATYTDLEPENAPEWYFSLKVDTNADYRLRDMVDEFWALHTNKASLRDVLGKGIEESDETDSSAQYTSALDRLTADAMSPLPLTNISTVIDSAQRRLLYSPTVYSDLAPIGSENLESVLRFIFPDARPNPKYPYPASFDRSPEFRKEKVAVYWENFQGVKSAPVGSLVWRFANVVANLHAYQGSNPALAHMWVEFVLELRYRWDRSTLICGLERGAPNSSSCLLNQKLQMLNCCIEKKLARAEKENEKNNGPEDPDAMEVEEESDDEDEFFDCDDDDTANPTGSSGTAVQLKPTGRLRKCGRLRLLKTGEPMYIPITQDPAPLTEDVVEEQAKILVELGNDAEGSELRAKMMSASLLSDMEAFKAANPGATLEDFVRWYSPRDWIEHEETDKYGSKTGELSSRMKVPGNLWIDVWSTANPVPVRRQKRLFDDTREAEKVLHWLGNQSIGEICQLLFPCLIHSASLKVIEEVDNLPVEYQLPATLPQLVSQFTRCFGHGCNLSDTNASKNQVMSLLSKCEIELTQIRSFQHKFPYVGVEKIMESKRTNPETHGPELLPKYIKIDGGYRSDIGKTIKEIFVKEQSVNHLVESENEFKFAKPNKRVFILKYIPPKSIAAESVGYLCLPQRMSCMLKEDLFVCAGTFSLRTDLG